MNKIFNPESKRYVLLNGIIGRRVLQKYINQLGGQNTPKKALRKTTKKILSPNYKKVMSPKEITGWRKIMNKAKNVGLYVTSAVANTGKMVWDNKGKIIAGLIAVGVALSAAKINEINNMTEEELNDWIDSHSDVNLGPFTGITDLKQLKRTHRKLARELHPDKPGGNNDEFILMNNMYAIAKKKLERND